MSRETDAIRKLLNDETTSLAGPNHTVATYSTGYLAGIARALDVAKAVELDVDVELVCFSCGSRAANRRDERGVTVPCGCGGLDGYDEVQQ